MTGIRSIASAAAAEVFGSMINAPAIAAAAAAYLYLSLANFRFGSFFSVSDLACFIFARSSST